MTVHWEAGQGEQDLYELSYQPPDGTPEPPVSVPSSDPLELRVEGLLPATDYTFNVKAVSGRDATFKESGSAQGVFTTGRRSTENLVLVVVWASCEAV